MLPFGIGFSEIVVIGIVLLLVVGPHKLPDLAKTMGKGLRVVRRAANEMRNAINVDEVQAVRRELTRPIHDWKNDEEPEDMELGPDGVLRPVRRNGPKPTPKAQAPAVVAAAPSKPSISLGKDDTGAAPAATPADPTAGLMVSTAGANAGAPRADAEDDEADDDEADPDAHRPPASVARHDPFFDRIKSEIERTSATVNATAGQTDPDAEALSRNAPVPREAPPADPARPVAEDADGSDRPA